MREVNDDDIIAQQTNLQHIREAELLAKVQYALDVTPHRIVSPVCGAQVIFTVLKLTEELDGTIVCTCRSVCIKECCDGIGALMFPDELGIEEFQEGRHRTGMGLAVNDIPECKWGSD